MYLSRFTVLAIDAAYLGGEEEKYIRSAGIRDAARGERPFEGKESGTCWFKLFIQFLEPSGMSEVAGGDHRNSFKLRPSPDTLG
jgi:hypothetical protein